MPVLKAPTNRTERDGKDAEKHNGDDHRDHAGNVLSRSSDDDPSGGQRQNESDQVDVTGCVRNGFHAFASNENKLSHR